MDEARNSAFLTSSSGMLTADVVDLGAILCVANDLHRQMFRHKGGKQAFICKPRGSNRPNSKSQGNKSICSEMLGISGSGHLQDAPVQR